MPKNEEMLQFETEEKKSNNISLKKQNTLLKLLSLFLLFIIILLFIKIYFLSRPISKEKFLKQIKQIQEMNLCELNMKKPIKNISEFQLPEDKEALAMCCFIKEGAYGNFEDFKRHFFNN